MQPLNFLRPVLIAAALLLIPLIAMQFTREVQWDGTDFAVMGALLLIAAFAFEFAARIKNSSRKLVIFGIIAFLFVYVWAELAVGIFDFPGISGS
jgi:hypothetical protein